MAALGAARQMDDDQSGLMMQASPPPARRRLEPWASVADVLDRWRRVDVLSTLDPLCKGTIGDLRSG